MNYLIKNFLRGLAIVVPFVVTIWVLYLTFISVDRLVEASVPGVGFLVTVTAIVLVGVLASNIVGRTVLSLMERVFIRAPIVKILYQSIKDLVEALVGDKKKFNRPVAVRLSECGDSKALGFVTRDDLLLPGSIDHVAVYFPQSYNFAGNLLLVPRPLVERIETDSSEVMAFIISGGISGELGTPRKAL